LNDFLYFFTDHSKIVYEILFMKKWLIKEPLPNNHELLADFSLPIAQLLYNRGFKNSNEAKDFFRSDYEELADPFLFSQMSLATDRIWAAIFKKERIIIHGDYDADGVTSAAILAKTLKILGADFEVFIPHREIDGYGLNPNNLNKFAESGCKLIITVDCGITNRQEVEILKNLGVETVVTDHHEAPEILPSAVAVIDPKTQGENYPCKYLSGAGVAYKLAVALLRTRPEGLSENELASFGGVRGYEKWLLDLVAIGTVADIVPLLNENRILTKWGLVVLAQTKNLGLQKLLEKVSVNKFDSFTIGFQLAPRLNAAGRMKHAEAAFRLLFTEDLDEAGALADELHENNLARQKILEKATENLKKELLEKKDEKVFFLYNENWAHGIIGLIAGRICDEFGKPVLAMTNCGGRIVGSGRSVVGLNITEHLTQVGEFLARFGGHAGACGFTLKNLEMKNDFENSLRQKIENSLLDIELEPILMVDGYFDLDFNGVDFLDELEKFSPFGEANPRPLFWLRDLTLVAIEVLGATGNHLRLMVKQNSPKLYKVMLFGRAKDFLPLLKINQKVEAIVEMTKNVWQGQVQREIKVVDLRVVN